MDQDGVSIPSIITPSPEQRNTTSTKSPMIIGVVVVLLFLVGVSTYFFGRKSGSSVKKSPTITSSPTNVQSPENVVTGWKTYTSEKYGFSLQYPTEVKIEEKDSENLVRFYINGPTQTENSEINDGLSLYIGSRPLNGKDLKEIVDADVANSKENGEILMPPIPLEGVGGFEYKARGLGEYIYSYRPQGNNRYILIIDGTVDPTKKGFENIVSQIIKTLQY